MEFTDQSNQLTTQQDQPEPPLNQNWLYKIKKSNKNKLIDKKYHMLTSPIPEDSEELSKLLGIETIEDKKNENSKSNPCEESILSIKWKNYVQISRSVSENNVMINFNQSPMREDPPHFGSSLLSGTDNLEAINLLIEEKYKAVSTENSRITQNYHPIFPFLLITSREMHRMVVSDYEIKEIMTSFEKKKKSDVRGEYYDYYQMGVIMFYQGDYINAYLKFKTAGGMIEEKNNLSSGIKESNPNIENEYANIFKWIAFAALVLLFCQENGKIKHVNFSLLKNLSLGFNENKPRNENDSGNSNDTFCLSCCHTRKESNLTKFCRQTTGYKPQIGLAMNNSITSGNVSVFPDYENDTAGFLLDVVSLAKDIQENLRKSKDNQRNRLECWWMLLYIAVYSNLNPNQKLFQKENVYDIKYCLKKIARLDHYMSYLAYAEVNLIYDHTAMKTEEILTELLTKYPTRVEGYLKFWNLLVKRNSPLINHQKALSVSELFWKKNPSVKFDSVYCLYVLISHSKTSLLVGNSFYSISFLEKEYSANFYYPSLLYLLGKYSSKSDSKNLKNVAISSLQEVLRLLWGDLQYDTYYWMGNAYYNAGDYEGCYKKWKIYLNNFEKCFNRKIERYVTVTGFVKAYQNVFENLYQFKRNIFQAKRTSQYEMLSASQVQDYFEDLEAIKRLIGRSSTNTNLTSSHRIYEYYHAMILGDVANNIEEAIRVYVNLIEDDNTILQPYFKLWKLLKSSHKAQSPSSEELLAAMLNLAYYMVTISTSEEVLHDHWVKSLIYYSKTLFLNEKYESSIEVLIAVLDLFAFIPLDQLKILSEINKKNKISMTNVFFNFESMLKFFSKTRIYYQIESIMKANYKRKDRFGECLINEKNILTFDALQQEISAVENEDVEANNNNNNSNNSKVNNSSVFELSNNQSNISELYRQYQKEQKENKGEAENLSEKKIADMNINSIAKLNEYLSNNIEKVDIPRDSFSFITIISNSMVLYLIGKFCAKANTKLEFGMMCLEDFIVVLKYQKLHKMNDACKEKNSMPGMYSSYKGNLVKAKFWKGVIHFLLNEKSNAKESFDAISTKIDAYCHMNIRHSRKYEKKLKFIKLFYQIVVKEQSMANDLIAKVKCL